MRVLFLHYADYLEIGIPGGISILSSVLKAHGHEVKVFDTTFLKPMHYEKYSNAGSGPSIFKKTSYTLEDLVADDPMVDMTAEFQRVLDSYDPDMLAVSVMTTNFDPALDLIGKVKHKCLTIFGGVHPTIAPEEVIQHDSVDMICLGEGEEAIVALANALQTGGHLDKIKNLWIKTTKGLRKNGYGKYLNLNLLPCPDWSVFDERHLFRPFEGEIYKGSFVTSSRGCPGACTYCINKTIRDTFRGCGNYFRKASVEKMLQHLRTLNSEYGANWLKFADDTFLLRTREELEELKDGMKPLGLKFGCSVQPSTIEKEKVLLAKEMGCVAMTVGIESGNESIRRTILNRHISNEKLKEGIRIIQDSGLRLSTFNMIGLPGETRENVFETIRINKELGSKAANVYIIYPFPGTEIARKYHINYRDGDGKMIPMEEAARFELSRMPKEEVHGLLKTFNLYLMLPEEYWDRIEQATGESEEAQFLFRQLSELARNYA